MEQTGAAPATEKELVAVPRDPRPHAVQRRDPMVRVRIKCRTENQVIPGGYILPRGETTCLVYAPDLPAIRSMIELEPLAIKQAEAFFLKAVEQEVKEELKDIPDEDGKRLRLAQARQEYSGSVEGTFFFLHKRDILPLESVEVLEENIPAPASQTVVEQQSFLASTLAKEISTALAQTLPAMIAAVVQAIQQKPSGK